VTPSRPALRAFAVYTGARLGLFVAVFTVLVLVGLGGFLVLAGAFLVSGLLSYLLLGRQRIAFGRVVEESVANRAERRRRAQEVDLDPDG
jgi:hypothetical protein